MKMRFALPLVIACLSCSAFAANKPLSNEDIVTMVKAGLPDSTITAAIKKGPCEFDVSAQSLITLKGAGVSPQLMEAMLSAGQQASPAQIIAPQGPALPSEADLGLKIGELVETRSKGGLTLLLVRKTNGAMGTHEGVPCHIMDVDLVFGARQDFVWDAGYKLDYEVYRQERDNGTGMGQMMYNMRPGFHAKAGDMLRVKGKAYFMLSEKGWDLAMIRPTGEAHYNGGGVVQRVEDQETLQAVELRQVELRNKANAAREEAQRAERAAKKAREDAAKALIAAAPPLSETEVKNLLAKPLPATPAPLQQLAGKDNKYTIQHPSTLRFKTAEGQSGYHGWLLFGNEDEITIGGSTSNFINKSKYTLDFCLKQSLERARGSLSAEGQVIEPIAITVDGQEGSLFVVTRIDKGIVVRAAYAVIVNPKKCLVSLTLHARADRFEDAFMSYRRVLDSLRFKKE